ncbi:MAG: L-2-amino-thiazoline-4-carboxylic acid hydrolase [Bacteroidetes bacterium]|nr:L-2-amino-thiazoline-4-carboxylic acid hydrolase [Bacteroidota bacterium]
MNQNKESSSQNRRKFIFSMVPACALTCMGISNLFAQDKSKKNSKDESEKEKFQNDFCRTYEKAWKWRFNYYIDMMEEFVKVLGREKLIKLIKNGTEEIYTRGTENDPNFKLSEMGNDFINSDYFNNALTFEIIENTDELLELKVTQCLWAKTFREKNAEDLGYATNCHSDFSVAKAINPKLHLERTKTLMQGFDCCHFRYTFES